MGQCAGVLSKRDDGFKRNIHSISHLTATDSAQVNRLLNLLHNNEVEMLTQIFTYHCRNYNVNCQKTYNVMIHDVGSLVALFPQLQSDAYNDRIRSNVFRAFDDDNKRCIDLRDFCRIFAISTRGTRSEMEELVFLIFADSSETEKSTEIRLERVSESSVMSRKAVNVRQTHPTGTSGVSGETEREIILRAGD